jgi:Tol biopolymer transport system component
MPLSPGERLSHYEILGELGRGGMGAVYRARDTRLGREVAVKVSEQQFSERFEREARVIASLNHPNICTLFDVGPNFLVMELIEGESPKGPLPVDTVLDLAKQMADALDYAHERSVTHRDLKPGNLKITPEGTLKVLDFGLAKVGQARSDTPSEDSPTLTMGMTEAGMILGTVAYMAPEQAKGKPVDKRADIWAYGVVLYELSTGKRPFQGADMAELLAAVLRDDPKLDEVPERLRPLIRKCLEKDPRKRLRDIADAMELLGSGSAPITVEKVVEKLVVEKAPPAKPYGWIAAGALALGLAVVLWGPWRSGTTSTDAPLTRLNVDLGPDAIAAEYNSFAISPDGRKIVYAVKTATGTQLATRSLESSAEVRLPGSEGAQNPTFLPSGTEIAYYAGGKLKKGSASGGAPTAFADVLQGLGMVWLPDGTALAPAAYMSGISKLPANGGAPTPLTKLTGTTITHRWPSYSSKANAVIFTSASTVSSMGDADLWAQPVAGGEPKLLVRGAYAGRVYETPTADYLLYVRDGTLFGVVFDAKTLQTAGEAVPLIDDLAGDPTPGSGHYDISNSGTLVYRAGRETAQTWPVLLMDHTGNTTPLLMEKALYMAPRYSPDGTKLAIASRGTGGLRVIDLVHGGENKFLNAGYPVWSVDGKYLVVRDTTTPTVRLAWLRADGSGERQLIRETGNNMSAYAFTPDGKTLILHEISPTTQNDILALPLDLTDRDHPKPGTAIPLVQTPAAEMYPSLTPDGKWLAYGSNETGRSEIYVKPYQGGSGRWQISVDGGRWAIWAPNGRALYFQSLDNHIMVSDISVQGDAITHSQPRQWSPVAIRNAGDNLSYAIHPDGQRFVVFPTAERSPDEKGNAHMTFVLNFADELRRKLRGSK